MAVWQGRPTPALGTAAVLFGLLLLPHRLPAADFRVLSDSQSESRWRAPESRPVGTAAVLLSDDPVAEWPTELVVRRAERLAVIAPGRLAISVADAEPWRVARLRAALPAVPILVPVLLEPPPETFAELRRRAESPLRALTFDGARSAGRGTLIVASQQSRPTRWRITALAPTGLFDAEQTIELAARARVTLPVAVPGGCGAWLLSVSEADSPLAWPVVVDPVDDGLRAEFRPGRHVTPAAASLPAVLTAIGQRVTGQLRAAAGLPFQTLSIPAGQTLAAEVPVLPGSAGFSRRTITAELVNGGQRRALRAIATSVPLAIAARRVVRLDDRLDDWRDAAWHAVQDRGQVVDGAARWAGPADAGLRWAVARDDTALLLAAAITDADVAEGDALELRWDPDVSAAGAPGSTTRQLVFDRAAAAGTWAGGWWVELRLAFDTLAVAAEGVIGWDVALRDADPGEETVVLAATGERWSAVDPARLGLLSLRPAAPTLRWWVEPAACDGPAMGN